MYLVNVEFHMTNGWEAIDVLAVQAAGRPAYFAGCGDHAGMLTRYLEWHVDTLEEAKRLMESLERIHHISVFIREA